LGTDEQLLQQNITYVSQCGDYHPYNMNVLEQKRAKVT